MGRTGAPPPAPGSTLQEKTYLELMRTADRLTRGAAAVLKTEDLSPTQYNVLRILRGAPGGLPCGEIGRRLITRCRQADDRRTVLTRITPQGLDTVHRLDAPVQAIHKKQLGHLRREQLLALGALLREARGGI